MGTLKSVSVNIAKSVQTVPLSLTVFKFSNYNDLASPESVLSKLRFAVAH